MIDKINEIKSFLTEEQFKLTMNIFREDVAFHKKYRNDSDKELCEVLTQTADMVKRCF